ncbi:MAG: hypothetical protein IPN29_03315 [Saprospiraceae bacterium]|nr:hypothetical protein [Saprospiraceae bacterium]
MHSLKIMWTRFVAPLLLAGVFMAFSINPADAQAEKMAYDKQLADSLGADAYGMKMYVMVVLKTGQVKIDDKKKVESLFAGHMQNINRLAESNKLVVAGPFEKNDKNFAGIFILNAANLEEAAALLDTDPAVKAGLLDAEMFQWYGSAALPLYLKYHDAVKSKDF